LNRYSGGSCVERNSKIQSEIYFAKIACASENKQRNTSKYFSMINTTFKIFRSYPNSVYVLTSDRKKQELGKCVAFIPA